MSNIFTIISCGQLSFLLSRLYNIFSWLSETMNVAKDILMNEERECLPHETGDRTRKTREKLRSFSVWGCSLFIFFIGLAIRLDQVLNDDFQPDELHWLDRSKEIVTKVEKGNIGNITSHLAHPGIPPAMMYAVTIWGAERYNTSRNLKLGDGGYVGNMTACRVVNALVSSLILPLLFFVLAQFLGYQTAGLAVLLLALSPVHVGASSIVHIDSVLALLVTLTWVLYLVAEKRSSLGLKLAAGFIWGLAVSTKPTALFILPAIYLSRSFVRIGEVGFKKEVLKELVPRWSDVWALLIGLLPLSVLFSRLWHFNNYYSVDLHINNAATALLEDIGVIIAGSRVVLCLIAICVIASLAVLFCERSKNHRSWWFSLAMVGLLLGYLSIPLMFASPIWANMLRFWLRIAGLSRVDHVAYGIHVNALQYGYLELFLTRFPLVIVIGVVLAPFVIYGRWGSFKSETRSFLLFSIGAIVFWVIFLSFSQKQATRYCLPIVPLLYAIASTTCIEGMRWLLATFARFTNSTEIVTCPKRMRVIGYAFVSSIVVLHFVELRAYSEHLGLFRNSFSGGIAYDLKQGIPVAPIGLNSVMSFLFDKSKLALDGSIGLSGELRVLVLGDMELSRYALNATGIKSTKNRILLTPFVDGLDGDYLVVFPAFMQTMQKILAKKPQGYTKVYSYTYKGVNIIDVYEIAPVDFTNSFTVRYLSFRKTGLLRKENQREVLIGRAGKDRKGFLYFGHYLRLVGGTYNIAMPAMLYNLEDKDLVNDSQGRQSDGDELIAKVDIGRCSRPIYSSELNIESMAELTWTCNFAKLKNNLEFKIYWFGKKGVKLGEIGIQSK